MIKAALLILFGFILLIKGADLLVDGASNIAKKLHIPEIIIGLTIVSIGTSMPELFVSITSSIEGYNDMAIGNIIGSNICNLLLILGLSTIISSIVFQKETKLIEIPMCLTLTLIFTLLCNTGNIISQKEGLLLIGLFICFILYTIYMAKNSEDTLEVNSSNIKDISLIKNIGLLLIGIVFLKVGGDFTVNNAVVVADKFSLSQKVISLTILAIGTSLPELVTSVTASIKGNSDIAIGNIIGSNVFNMLLIIGSSSVIKTMTFNPTYNTELIILIIAMIILSLFPFIKPKDKMTRSNGLVYLLMYISYMIMLFVR